MAIPAAASAASLAAVLPLFSSIVDMLVLNVRHAAAALATSLSVPPAYDKPMCDNANSLF